MGEVVFLTSNEPKDITVDKFFSIIVQALCDSVIVMITIADE